MMIHYLSACVVGNDDEDEEEEGEKRIQMEREGERKSQHNWTLEWRI